MRNFVILTTFILLLLSSKAISKPMSADKQKKMIDSKVIKIGMKCNNLSKLLGNDNDVSWLWIGNKNDVHGHYVLIETFTRDANKVYYYCKQKRNSDANATSKTALESQDLIKIFYNSFDMFQFIFRDISENSKKYIFKTLFLPDYNITRNELLNAYMQAQTRTVTVVEPEIKETTTTTKKDTTPPRIEVASKIKIKKSEYVIEGKVFDDSKKIYIKVDGQNIDVKNGKFKIKRFSPVDEKVKIVAIDQWNNKSSKIVNVVMVSSTDEVVKALEGLSPPANMDKRYDNRVAIIIGIEKYDQIPKATYANLDAKWFYEYANRVFGIRKDNINLLIDQDASLIKTKKALFKWLPGKIKPNKTELIIFYAGHGLAHEKELYLLPYDSDPDLLNHTAWSQTSLIESINQLKPKSVIMFIDACYSGVSRDEETLLADARPVQVVASDDGKIPKNFMIFSASKQNQWSSGLKEAKHGIFSYYLMKGLEGKADSNGDKKITSGELLSYMDQNVSQKALLLGRQQNPLLSGPSNKILVKF